MSMNVGMMACSDQAKEMMLTVTPSLRITANNLLRHPWIKIAKTPFPKKRMGPTCEEVTSEEVYGGSCRKAP